ncbi:acyl-CoA dehydrogenase [bacterium]|nr:acyl-CoA dehydrogenase [bacterium]
MKLLFNLYKSLLPPISKTESEALEAGTVWWDAELFSGRPNWKVLNNLQITKLTPGEQRFLDGPVRRVCSMVNDWDVNYIRKDLPPEVWEFLKENKFFGMNIKREYGGLEFSALAQSKVISMLSSRNLSLAITAMVPNSLGPGELLHRFGTDEQKLHYLPKLAIGDEIPAFALTGPYAGSDAAAMRDTGIVCRQDGILGIRLNWEKRYITLGPVCTVLGLAFKLEDPDKLIGGERDLGITLALIPTDLPGVSIGRRHIPADQAFMNGPNYGKDVFIPLNYIIGERAGIGKGWSMLMSCLAAGRAISLPALSMSGLKMATRIGTAYGKVRKQFKIPIGKMEGIEEALSRIIGNTYIINAACEMTCSALDQGHQPSVISAILKYEATERMRSGINDAMDIMGGKGISNGPNNLMFNSYISQPIAITVEGANILTRSLIIFAQGGLRCHPYLSREMTAIRRNSPKRFNRALLGHLFYTFSNLLTTPLHNITKGRFIKAPSKKKVSPKMRHWYRKLGRESRNFALLADITLMLLGGKIKRKQKLSGRFADVLSELYLMSGVLKKFETDNRLECDRVYVRWAMRNGLYRVQCAFEGILQNYPVGLIGWVLRKLVFPFGRRHKPVSDKLQHDIVAPVMEQGFIRSRLIDHTYLPDDELEPLRILEYTFRDSKQVDRFKKMMKSNEGTHTKLRVDIHNYPNQKKLFEEYGKKVKKVIDVDDFDNELK